MLTGCHSLNLALTVILWHVCSFFNVIRISCDTCLRLSCYDLEACLSVSLQAVFCESELSHHECSSRIDLLCVVEYLSSDKSYWDCAMKVLFKMCSAYNRYHSCFHACKIWAARYNCNTKKFAKTV